MFNNILVPLDGSQLSEAALPAALIFARKYKSNLNIIHILEHDAPEKVHGQHHLQNYNEAVEYLNKTCKVMNNPDLNINCRVKDDFKTDVVDEIIGQGKELSIDLIIMTTHGWGGLKGIIFGNIAQQIITKGNIPVLFIPPDINTAAGQFSVKNILVPIDGTPEHEAGLTYAINIAESFKSEMLLIMVVPTPYTERARNQSIGIFLPSTIKEILNLAKNKADIYLKDKIAGIRKAGIKVSGDIARGDPAEIIAKLIEKKDIELTILGTHGKAGLSAFWAESVAARISNKIRSPLLFIPIKL